MLPTSARTTRAPTHRGNRQRGHPHTPATPTIPLSPSEGHLVGTICRLRRYSRLTSGRHCLRRDSEPDGEQSALGSHYVSGNALMVPLTSIDAIPPARVSRGSGSGQADPKVAQSVKLITVSHQVMMRLRLPSPSQVTGFHGMVSCCLSRAAAAGALLKPKPPPCSRCHVHCRKKGDCAREWQPPKDVATRRSGWDGRDLTTIRRIGT